jgi:hypothetical protein
LLRPIIIGDLSGVLLVLVVEESWIIIFLLHVLGWGLVGLVDLHLVHLLCKLSSFFLFLGLLLHVKLLTTEFLEDVLVMEDGVGKFIFEFVSLQELRDSWLDFWHFQNLMDGRALCRINLQDLLNQLCSSGESWGEGSVLA